jgi:hypothetical protein
LITQITPVAIQAIEDRSRGSAAQRVTNTFDGGPHTCFQNVGCSSLDLRVRQVSPFLARLAVSWCAFNA